MVEKLAELRSLSMEELIERHDRQVTHVVQSLAYYRDEIHRREQAKVTRTIRDLTIAITVMTFVMLMAVTVQVVIAL